MLREAAVSNVPIVEIALAIADLVFQVINLWIQVAVDNEEILEPIVVKVGKTNAPAHIRVTVALTTPSR